MFDEKAQSTDIVAAALATAKPVTEGAGAAGVYTLQCYDKDGNLKWEESTHNLVVNVGLQDMNTKYFTGSSYTAAWYIGLYGAGASNTPAATDTSGSHAGWTEITPYSNATRPAAVFGATGTGTSGQSAISNSAATGGTVASFTINSSSTVGGAFLISNSTKGGTTGILFSASDFTAPGSDRTVVSGDTLNVTYTFTVTAT